MIKHLTKNGVHLQNKIPTKPGDYFFWNNAKVMGSSRLGIVTITKELDLISSDLGVFPVRDIAYNLDNPWGTLRKDYKEYFFSPKTIDDIMGPTDDRFDGSGSLSDFRQHG